MNILFAASEAFPFVKTGGLGDVMHALPAALAQSGDDVRIVIPAYRDAIEASDSVTELGGLDVQGAGNRHHMRILEAKKKGVDTVTYLVDIPALYDRPGSPYSDENGIVWPDNAERFIVFSRAVALMTRWLSGLKSGHSWSPDVVHCNDWQTGLVPAFLSRMDNAPATVFTIHNLSYDGFFSYEDFKWMALPQEWWSPDYVEFHGGLSLLKAGMVFSDAVTTVSPNYAKEVCTSEHGSGLDGVLRNLGSRFSGILNGIDTEIWNPETDPYIKQNYHFDKQLAAHKRTNKLDLLKTVGLPKRDVPLLGFIGRLVEQKGIDLITEVLPKLFETTNVCVVILGSGHTHYEDDLMELVKLWPDRLYVYVGYSEELAHKIEAGCDLFLMPSMFEPCGLNQMYSLHYGTLPVVNNTGGLADTVVNVTLPTLKDQTATGFVMLKDDANSLYASIISALELYENKALWERVQKTGMSEELGWETSAQAYRKLYTAHSSKRRISA